MRRKHPQGLHFGLRLLNFVGRIIPEELVLHLKVIERLGTVRRQAVFVFVEAAAVGVGLHAMGFAVNDDIGFQGIAVYERIG